MTDPELNERGPAAQPDPDDAPLDAAAMLELLERQKRAVGLSFVKPVAWLYLIWGVAWLVGFLVLWLTAVTDWLPTPVAATSFALLIVVSSVASAIIGTRIGRGVQGSSAFQGVVYGTSWPIFAVAFAAVGIALIANEMSIELASLYFPAAYALMVGMLYVLGAALWHARSQLVLGLVLLVIGSVAPFFGAPTNNLIMAIGGGGAFLVAAAHFALVHHRLR